MAIFWISSLSFPLPRLKSNSNGAFLPVVRLGLSYNGNATNKSLCVGSRNVEMLKQHSFYDSIPHKLGGKT